MAFQILLNVFLAFVWMFLTVSFDGASFLIGYLIGLLIIFILRRFFHSRFYLIPLFVIVKLVFIFLKELLLSNIAVVKVVLNRSLDIRPGIFALPTELEKDWEVTVLSLLITLTPGTLVLDVSEDGRTLYIHALDVPDVKETIKAIKESFEKTIMEVSK
ncbi:Na+/H+ antiporter subunit E [Bacillus alveayuensis]|uniref:Na+/H+ antiporter subunit E n=1 Tax=Aeribacillus alveayuensis TaxID=279215 RepID=UPI0005D102A4|nr:Na+/H+ antiporter subunit E [Bacillus alveayuensis]